MKTTRYFYDGNNINVLYETDETGNMLRNYIYSTDGIRVAMKSQNKTFYYHYNPHGDVVALTDDAGNIVARYEYDAWGNVITSNAQEIAADNPFGYAGYMYDQETSMYYLMARYYHPKHGVFISVDPDPGDDDDPITQNGLNVRIPIP
jgi:RHS repeat-associated protein